MDQETWNRMSRAQRDKVRDLSGLTPQLVGLEGWRVEVLNKYGKTWQFIVGRSTGWRPCHLEIATARSHGGGAADSSYVSVTAIRKVR